MSRYSLKRDKKIRDKFLRLEGDYRALRSIYLNSFIDSGIRELAREKINKKGGGLRTKMLNRCVLSGRSRGVVREFRVSRMEFKALASSGYLVGVKKKVGN